jgi:hypothetical protein
LITFVAEFDFGVDVEEDVGVDPIGDTRVPIAADDAAFVVVVLVDDDDDDDDDDDADGEEDNEVLLLAPTRP